MKKIFVYLFLCAAIFIGTDYTYAAKDEGLVTKDDSKDFKEAYENFVLGVESPAYSLNNEAILYFNKGNYDKAKEKYREALKISPGNPLILNNLAWTCIMAEDYKDAVAVLFESFNADDKNPSTHFSLGVANWYLGNVDEAEKYLLKSISLDNGRPYSHLYLSKVKKEKGDLEGAIAEAELCAYILGNSWDPDVALYIANLYAKAGMLQKAILQYQKLVDEVDYSFDAYYGLGSCYDRFDDYKKAEAHFKRAMDIDDENPLVYYGLGKLYSKDDDELKKALKYAEKALKLDEENPKYFYLVGWIYYRMGETEDALEYFKEALKRDPTNDEYRYQIKELERGL